jgi:hypothetical protein
VKPTGSSPTNCGIDPIRRNHIAAAVAVLVVAGYSGWWIVTARAVGARIDGWIAQQQAAGAKIAPAHVSVTGYPFSFSVKLTDVSLTLPTGLGFTSQSLKVRSRPWSLTNFKVNATGGFALTLPPGNTRPALTLAGETLKGHAGFGNTDIPTALDLTADTVSATPAGATGPTAPELTVATVEFVGSRPTVQPKADTDLAYDLSLKLTDMSAQLFESNPLGGTIHITALHGQLLGVPPATWDAAGIKAWRDAGGTINLLAAAIQWGTLSVSGSGTLALDKDMQPEGAMTIRLVGFNEALDSLAAAGWVKIGPASLAKFALGIAARPGPDGKPMVDTPLSIQDRKITVDGAKLGVMPELKLD